MKLINKSNIRFVIMASFLIFLGMGWVMWVGELHNNDVLKETIIITKTDTTTINGLIKEMNEVYRYNSRLRDTIADYKVWHSLLKEEGIKLCKTKKGNTYSYWVEQDSTTSNVVP